MKIFRCIIVLVLVLLVASLSLAKDKDSPVYKKTLKKAKADLSGQQLDPNAVAPAKGIDGSKAPLVTSAPGMQTICSGTKTIVCTQSPSKSTKCGSSSQTACTTDPACGPTTRPSGTTTKCRGEYTACENGVVIACTSAPAAHTHCVNSNTYCVATDPNCFTYLPAPQTTICPGMLTDCWLNQPRVCTRDPHVSTECTQFSKTRCAPDCNPTPVTELALIDPSSGARGSTVTALVAISGDEDDFVIDGTDVVFGEGIEVQDFEVISPVEIFVTLQIDPLADLGPRNVYFASGEDGTSPTGQHVIHPGVFTVTEESIPTLNSTGMVIVVLLLLSIAIVFMKRRQKTTR